MSVSGKPSHAHIQITDVAYQLFREGKASGLKIEDGKVIISTLRLEMNLGA